MINFNHPDLEDQTTFNKTFADLNLPKLYVKALQSLEYVKPTTVQFHSISLGIKQSSNNLIIQSKSGTGKTLSFATISLIKLFEKQKLNIRNVNQIVEQNKKQIKKCSILILQPTRQLAVQVYQVIRKILSSQKNIKTKDQEQLKFKKFMRQITISLSIGGLPIQDDKKNYLQIGYDIVIGTVGRIKQLVSKNILKFDNLSMIVFDEGDKLFEQNDSINKINLILSKTDKPQMLFYSATYNKKVIQLLKKFGLFTFIKTVAQGQHMNVKIQTQINQQMIQNNQNLSLVNIKKFNFTVKPNTKSLFSQKNQSLKQILKQLQYKKCLIFVQKKAQINQVHDYLKQFNPLLIHGSLTQSARIKLLNQLNYNKIIITSDLLARGIDILVDLIILFNATEGQNFWHRIGRTGRIGRKGVVISLDKIQNWQQYNYQNAQKALKQVQLQHKQEVFGQYMTQLGRWHDVDPQIQCENVNNYKYFDEQKFKAQILTQILLQQQNNGEQKIQNMNIKQFQDQHINQEILNTQNLIDLNYIKKILNCKKCIDQIKKIQQLTGYKFEILKYLSAL